MVRNILLGGLLVLPLFFSACESAEERADRRAINGITDSLAATGQHGYYVATYYVGRFKNTRMDILPFQVVVRRMAAALYGVPIHVQFQEGGYRLRYTLPDGEVSLAVTGSGVLETKDVDLALTVPDSAQYKAFLRFAQNVGYVLKVYPY